MDRAQQQQHRENESNSSSYHPMMIFSAGQPGPSDASDRSPQNQLSQAENSDSPTKKGKKNTQ